MIISKHILPIETHITPPNFTTEPFSLLRVLISYFLKQLQTNGQHKPLKLGIKKNKVAAQTKVQTATNLSLNISTNTTRRM